jgi:DNA-binding beta-propeller fold protein YncE
MQAGRTCTFPAAWPLSEGERVPWLRSCCVVAEGGGVPLSHTVPGASSSRCPPDVCVGTVLGDALRRVSVLGGREGMSRSLGSVYGGVVTLFLDGGLRGVESRVIDTPGVKSYSNGVAVSRDGSTLLATDYWGLSHLMHEFRVVDGSRLRVIGSKGDGPLQFHNPLQVWIASDDFVFVADCNNHRVQVLTPTLDFHCFIGVGQLSSPRGVCADGDVVVVSEGAHRISVFSRGDGALLRRFGSEGSGDGQLHRPYGLCFMPGHRHIAVADRSNSRVSVFSVEGEFIRHVGVGKLSNPAGVACSAFDELVVADTNTRISVFSASGELLKTMGCGGFGGVAIHGGTIFAQDYVSGLCVVFK